jgi:hypothetical protein
MAKPWIHAESSVRQWGGVPEDYVEIHTFMDSSKGAIADNRHRCLTHTSWFLSNVLERVKFSNSGPCVGNSFPVIINSNGREISVRDLGEQHILEDFAHKFIPTAQDYIENMTFEEWMQNGKETPSSFKEIERKIENKKTTIRKVMFD